MGAFDDIQRVIIPEKKFFSKELSPGVLLEQFHPGGKDGPNGEVHNDVPGGQTWSDPLLLGSPDSFQMLVPDIRLPPNQLWPQHWHDTWTVVLILEGRCVLGDWYMQPGDVFITEPSIEYGPLLIGPHGCRMVEIFAQAHLGDGGYAPEYWDHPTLYGGARVFAERSALNARNNGRQMLSLEGVSGTWCERLESGREWQLGAVDDPDRGYMRNTRLAAGESIERCSYGDWRFLMVLDGEIEIAGHTVGKDGYLMVAPDSPVDTMLAGPQGAHLLELARTAAGIERRPV